VAGEVDDSLARVDLAGLRNRTEPCGEIERAAAVAAFDRHRLAGVESDA
jgi:hypothetical protein